MKRILFITNYASPYKVEFYDELSRFLDVTVLFSDKIEDQKHRTSDWFTQGTGGFHAVQLTRCAGTFMGENLCLDVLDWLKKPWDAVVLCGYSCPTVMLAMAWLKLRRIPFYIQADGGLIRKDSRKKYLFKRLLVSQASAWISSGRFTTNYLVHYGAREEAVHHYPFTSLWQKDILEAAPAMEEKLRLRKKLEMPEGKIVLYVGRYDPQKGMDDLLHAVPELGENTGVYFVGGEPTEEHLNFCRENKISNAHFVGFRRKEFLAEYYKAADVLVLPTKSDVWGLVINEAMACGLPVITTDQCVAGLELIEDGINGYIVPVDDQQTLVQTICRLLHEDYVRMGEAALERIRPYTIENMVKAYVEIFS